MAFLPGYCSLDFAETINEESDAWNELEDSQKELAITNGRLYIDKNYTCIDEEWDTEDYDTIPDEVQYANAVLADQYANGTLTTTDAGVSGPVTSKRVKAGSVESETTYAGMYSTSVKKTDQKPDITLLLSPYCSLGNGNKDLIRV